MSLRPVSQDATDPVSIVIAALQLNSESLSRARRLATDSGEALPVTLTRLGLVSERAMADAFAKALDLPFVSAGAFAFDILPFQGFSPAFLRNVMAERPEIGRANRTCFDLL